MLKFAVLYRICQHDERLSVLTDGTPYAFVDGLLQQLHNNGELAILDAYWVATDAGRTVLERQMSMYQRAEALEVFATVNLHYDVPRELLADPRSAVVLDEVYDPRFEESGDSVDLRIAMIAFLHQSGATNKEIIGIDPHSLVFVQMLEDGLLDGDFSWFDLSLGTPQQEIEAIVDSAIKWTDVATSTKLAKQKMKLLFEAGKLETVRRQGYECSNCGAPLAVVEDRARRSGRDTDGCPACGAALSAPVTIYECPNCGSDVDEDSAACRGCGARIDFNLPEGTIEKSGWW